jgi:photosystem II stability/assembly factor-like uncharacterized protein
MMHHAPAKTIGGFMKTLTKILFFFLLATQICFAQWVQTNGPIGGYVNCFLVSGLNLFAATSNGVFLTANNGSDWVEVSTGLTDRNVFALAEIGTNLIAGTGGGVFLSTSNGSNWSLVNSELTNIRSLSKISTNLFAGTWDSGVLISTNYGASWSLVSDVLPKDVNDTTRFVSTDCLVSNGTNLFTGTYGYGVFLTTNNGTSWTEVNYGLTYRHVFCLAASDTNLLAGTGFWSAGSVFLSTNNGTSWTEVNSGLPSYSYSVNSLVIYDKNFLAGTDFGGVFISTDSGTNWTEVNSGLTYRGVNALAVSGMNLFAGIGNGIWRRPLAELIPVELTSFIAAANGKEVILSWTTATELNNQGFEVQRRFCSNDFVTVGSVRGNGTTTTPNNYTYVDKLFDAGKYYYRLKQIDFGGKYEYSQEVEVNWSPFTSYKLEQNYPNPFNPTTTIGFGIIEKGNVRLSILNILGEEIRILLNEEKEAGYHLINFNGSDLPSGVYFYQLKASNFSETKKMILLR